MELKCEKLTYEYDAGTSMAKRAVDEISLTIPSGQFVGIVGHTGSGKTTFVQLLDGLLKPTAGVVSLDGVDIASKGFDRRSMRSSVGIVFQYPEYQLFEQTVIKDVSFGPKNQGLSDEDAAKEAAEALRKVGISEEMHSSSPFELSGGQRRRVAIAGVIAMRPACIVLDEPTAMLDPAGRAEVIRTIRELNEQEKVTIILITHNMEETVYADRILVMDHGKVVMSGHAKEVFSRVEELEHLRLGVPQPALLAWKLKQKGLSLPDGILTMEELAEALEELRKNGQKGAAREL